MKKTCNNSEASVLPKLQPFFPKKSYDFPPLVRSGNNEETFFLTEQE